MKLSNRNVPLIDLQGQYLTLKKQIHIAIDRVLTSQEFILGTEVSKFEEEIAEYLGVRHAIGVSSGTDAILVALMALNIGHGDEVITTAYTFYATAGSIARLGATPVFVDVDPEDYNLDSSQIQSAISEKTKAIIPVHLFGHSCAMSEIMTIAINYNIPVIEDVAQSIGAKYDGKRLGTLGKFGCFSFFPSKNLGGYGDGGLVVTNDEELAHRVAMLRSHGFMKKHESLMVGGNFRLDAIQAAILRVKLPYLDTWNKQRQSIAHKYIAELTSKIDPDSRKWNCQHCVQDCQTPIVYLPKAYPEDEHVYNQFIIKTSNRDRLQKHLKEFGIQTSVYYPIPLHLQPSFKNLDYNIGDLPHCECAAATTLAIPIYPELDTDSIKYVSETIGRFYE